MVICLRSFAEFRPRWTDGFGAMRHESIQVDTTAKGTSFPYYWERMFGSGRAIRSLWQSDGQDLRTVEDATGFEYVRFHAIFHDQVGIFDELDGNPLYNFSYVDQIYDGLLQAGSRSRN